MPVITGRKNLLQTSLTTPSACLPSDTFEALKALTAANGNTCLQYYGLQRNGTAEERRRRLTSHLGVRLHNNVFQALEDRLHGLDRHQQRSEARQRNFATWNATDDIVPFLKDGDDPLPASFPGTQQGMLDLPDRDLTALHAYYGIDGGDKRQLVHFLGIS
jgi:hypothetical protein